MNISKKDLRREILSLRNSIQNKSVYDKIICEKLVGMCASFSNIFVYINFGSETDTINFINKMLYSNKNIFVPVCNPSTCTMRISRINSLDDLEKNMYGIAEPREIIYDNEILDAIILPGSAFDTAGNRIGYGKGYYDKFISQLDHIPLKIGICYDFQLLKEIPSEPHDIKMDVILTEKRILSL